MQFVFLKSKNKLTENLIHKIKNSFITRTSILCSHKDYEWINESEDSIFIGRNPDLLIYEKYNTFFIDNGEMNFIHGWLKNNDEDNLLEAEDICSITDETKLDGFYDAAHIDKQGIGEFYCSSICPHLYYAESDNYFAISNRISILSEIFDYTTPNKKHLASHIQFQHELFTYDTMYENIFWIPYGTKIKIQESEILLNHNYNFLYDESLKKKFDENSELYWDEFYEKVLSQVKALINLDITDNLTLGLSGGVDSRMLLSLYYKYIKDYNIFTGGPAYSPEVIVARMVTNKLNIQHSTPSLRNVSKSMNLLEKLPQHLFAREFEMCPWDFGWIKERCDNNIKVDGQEFVRTAPYINNMSSSKILKEYDEKYRNIYAISKDYMEPLIKENKKIALNFLNNMDDIQKIPCIKRMYTRGRWASRVHETIFDYSFHIYPLLTNIFIKYVYNSSVESIYNQNIVYEILKRSCPELLDVPLFNKEFSQNPIPYIENKIPGKLNYKNLYLVKYFDFIKKYILDNFNFIDDIVDREFINNLKLEQIQDNPKLSQILYNILQTIVLLKTPNFEDLKNELKLDYDYINETFEDTYDEDCISAFVKYNEDIVKLKQENFILKNKNSMLIDKINTEEFITTHNTINDWDSDLIKYSVARFDCKNNGSSSNKLKFLSISDDNVKMHSPNWFKNENGEGVVIESFKGRIDLKIQCINSGIFSLNIRGPDIRDKNGKRFPIFIDLKKASINGENYLQKNKLVYHDTPYVIKKEVESNEIINIHAEWSPFTGDSVFET